MSSLRTAILVFLAWLTVCGTATALSVPGERTSEEPLFETLAHEPPDVRAAALRVAAEPTLLLQLEGIRSWSSRSLAGIIEAEPEQDRDDLAALARYPAAVEDIVDAAVVSSNALEEIAAQHPEEIRAAILRAGSQSPGALSRMRDLQRQTEEAFADLLSELDPQLADALELVAGAPAAMEALQQDLSATRALGEAWENDPFAVEAALREAEDNNETFPQLGDSWNDAGEATASEAYEADSVEIIVQPTTTYSVWGGIAHFHPRLWYWAPYYAYDRHHAHHGFGSRYSTFYAGYPYYYRGRHHGHDRHRGHSGHRGGHKDKDGKHHGDHKDRDGKHHGDHKDKDGDRGKHQDRDGHNGRNHDEKSDRGNRDGHGDARDPQERRLKRDLRDLVGAERGDSGGRAGDRASERRGGRDGAAGVVRTSTRRTPQVRGLGRGASDRKRNGRSAAGNSQVWKSNKSAGSGKAGKSNKSAGSGKALKSSTSSRRGSALKSSRSSGGSKASKSRKSSGKKAKSSSRGGRKTRGRGR